MKKYRSAHPGRWISLSPSALGYTRYTGKRGRGRGLTLRVWRMRWLTLLGLVLSALGIGFCSLRLAAGSFGQAMFDSYLEHPAILWLNLAPVLLLILFLWFLIRQAWLAVLLGGGLITILSISN